MNTNMNTKENRCQKPDQLKNSPQDCSREQNLKCHGETRIHPCVREQTCEQPRNLKGSPLACSPEQVQQCHGDDAGHPCVDK